MLFPKQTTGFRKKHSLVRNRETITGDGTSDGQGGTRITRIHMKERVDFHLLKAQYLQRMEVYHGLERTVALSQHAMTKSGSEAEMNTANGEYGQFD